MMILFLFIFVFCWLIGLTALLMRTLNNYNALTKGVSDKTLSEVLKSLLHQQKLSSEEYKNVQAELKNVQSLTDHAIQKIGLVRFNPFLDTGGGQSFVLSLLDRENSGIVITSLYARGGMRWYVKTIEKGKSVEHELSKEEREAISKTK